MKGQFKRLGRMAADCHSSTFDLRLLDLNSTEQSENVYENKGPLWYCPRVALACRLACRQRGWRKSEEPRNEARKK
jgi:hypothetical protein